MYENSRASYRSSPSPRCSPNLRVVSLLIKDPLPGIATIQSVVDPIGNNETLLSGHGGHLGLHLEIQHARSKSHPVVEK